MKNTEDAKKPPVKPRKKVDRSGLTKAGKKTLEHDLIIQKALQMSYAGASYEQIRDACGFASARGARRQIEIAIKRAYNPDFAIRVQVVGVNRIERLLQDMFEDYHNLRNRAKELISLDDTARENQKEIKRGYALLGMAEKKSELIIQTIKDQSEVANVSAFVEALATSGKTENNVNVNANFVYEGVNKMPTNIAKGFRMKPDEEVMGQMPEGLKQIMNEAIEKNKKKEKKDEES